MIFYQNALLFLLITGAFVLVDGCIIVDDEILLKQLEIEDSEEVFKLTEENKEYLLPWFEWASNLELEKTQDFIKKSCKKNQNREGCDLGIYYNGKLVGVIALMNYDKEITTEAEIAYWLAKSYNGKGIMRRVCKRMEDYCFTSLKFNTLYIIAFAENKASRTIPEKLGFDIVDADIEPTLINNKKSYYIYYSKTQSEYKANFWNYLALLLNRSEIIIDSKKGEYSKYLNIVCPVDLGYLKNNWDEKDQIDVFIGSKKDTAIIDSIICTVDFKNKFSDIKILYGCTPEEKNEIFSLLSEKEGVLLVENPKYQ